MSKRKDVDLIRDINENIAGTRDKLIHDYFGVNIDIVWNIVKEEIPSLLSKINIILKNMRGENG
mgnify:CR=1 FL=1